MKPFSRHSRLFLIASIWETRTSEPNCLQCTSVSKKYTFLREALEDVSEKVAQKEEAESSERGMEALHQVR